MPGNAYHNLLNYHKYINCHSKVSGVKAKFKYFISKWSRLILKYISLAMQYFLPEINPEPCDILVMGTCDVDINHSREVWDILAAKGYKLKKTLPQEIPTYKIAFTRRVSPDRQVPAELFFHYIQAKYLVQKYSPKLVCLFYSNDVLPTFVRQEMRSTGKTIFIPHGPHPSMYLYTSIDFDYYFSFGDGSLDSLLSNKVRFGNTKVVKTGSPMIMPDYNLPVNRNTSNILYFSSWWV